jgi:hypothetical protein
VHTLPDFKVIAGVATRIRVDFCNKHLPFNGTYPYPLSLQKVLRDKPHPLLIIKYKIGNIQEDPNDI